MKKTLVSLLLLCCTALPAAAQSTITLPIAANAVADIGNGPIKVRMVAGNASIFTAQGSGIGSTSGSSTSLTLTATPTTPPIVGALISGTGIISGTTVTAFNGTTGITLSAPMTVAGGTTVSWGAACSSTIPSVYIPASVQVGFYIFYTQARVCAVSPGGPVNTLLIEPVYDESGTITADSTPTSGFMAGQLLYSDGSQVQAGTVGSGLSFSGGTLTATGVGGPSSSTIGCAAPWANTSGTLLGNNCGLSISGSNVTATNILIGSTTAVLSGSVIPNNGSLLSWGPLGSIGNSNSIWTNDGAMALSVARLFIGAAAAVNTGNAPESPSDWLNTLVSNTTQNAQFVSISSVGLIGAIGASRSSDFTSEQESGTIGVAGYASNDNTSYADGAWGGYFQAMRATGVTGATVSFESDVQNEGSTVIIHPYNFFPAGLTASGWIGCGAGAESFPCSVAFGILDNVEPYEAGIVAKSSAFDTSIGSGGDGVFAELARGQSIRWENSGATFDSEIWGDASGFEVASAIKASGGLTLGNNIAISENGSSQGVYAAFTNSTNTRTATVGILDGFNGGINQSGGSILSQISGTTYFTVNTVAAQVSNVGLEIGSPTGGSEGTGTINAATGYYANGSVGVTCSGSPTASFASTEGIVTHC